MCSQEFSEGTRAPDGQQPRCRCSDTRNTYNIVRAGFAVVKRGKRRHGTVKRGHHSQAHSPIVFMERQREPRGRIGGAQAPTGWGSPAAWQITRAEGAGPRIDPPNIRTTSGIP
jgi:hypothetical protein